MRTSSQHIPEVSVIMAEYKTREQDLREAIESILVQSFKDFELIIVDDRGRSDLIDIVKDFNDDRVKIIKNPRNIGFAASLNIGIRYARGLYIVRMDTDDIALPDRIEKTYSFIKAHPEYDVVGTRAVEFSGDIEFGILGKKGEKDKRAIIMGDTLVHPSVIIRKASLEGLQYDEHYRRSQDYVLWCEMLLRNRRLYVMEQPLIRYRVNADDYKKRGLRNRRFELKARIKYYPKLGARIFDYRYILKSIIAGLLPHQFVRLYRERFVLQATGSQHE